MNYDEIQNGIITRGITYLGTDKFPVIVTESTFYHLHMRVGNNFS